MQRRTVLGAWLGLAAGGTTRAFAAAEGQVTIDNFTFSPQNLSVAAGTRVTWTNRDDIPHKLLSADGKGPIASPLLDTDDKYSLTFATPGRYAYFCSLHPHMQGEVTVG